MKHAFQLFFQDETKQQPPLVICLLVFQSKARLKSRGQDGIKCVKTNRLGNYLLICSLWFLVFFSVAPVQFIIKIKVINQHSVADNNTYILLNGLAVQYYICIKLCQRHQMETPKFANSVIVLFSKYGLLQAKLYSLFC